MKKLLFVFPVIFITALFISCSESVVSPDPVVTNMLLQMKYITDTTLQNSHIPGIVALVIDRKRGFQWAYGTGVSDIPNNLPTNIDYTYRIGSVTKTFTITVLLQLIGEGKLSLDDKLSKFYPQYPKADSITVRMLCNMTSGIRNYTGPEFFAEMWANPSRLWSPDELIDRGFAQGFDSIPSGTYKYSNTNTILAGKIIQKITNRTLEQEINTRIIQKLGLQNTGFLTSGIQLPGAHGRGYYFINYVPGQDLTEYFDLSTYWAAGSVYSKPLELAVYAKALVNGGLLPDSLQQKRLNSDFNYTSPKDGYGLGIYRHGSFYGHSGELQGFMGCMYHSIEKDCTIIIYLNSLLLGTNAEDINLAFLKTMYGNDY